jgi:cell division protein FtsI (penicillin-binding protein 3)
MIDCQGGQITLFGRTIHDDKGEHYGVITVHEALEHSSDVAAVKLALKVGQDKLSEYVHNFGFGSRSGVEMPGETRGLLRPVNRWTATSIGSIAIGQEVGVTPIQLVSMVSTIANGGVYLPPHVLMPGQIASGDPNPKAVGPLAPQPFKAGGELPDPLPPGAHRVISTLTAAQMRKMMEGVVLFGTGRPAQLNGYSAGGKTGTAQKVDPATHLYSKTMHIASFAGIAPVNNPVIAVAVIIDNPKGANYHGTAVSAPVFQEVAQQVLEYLGVPHDVEIKQPKTPVKPEKQVVEDDAQEPDVNALFAAVNDLPADDPLRAQPVASRQSESVASAASADKSGDAVNAAANAAVRSAGISAASVPKTKKRDAEVGGMTDLSQALAPQPIVQPAEQASIAAHEDSVVALPAIERSLKVPTLIGLPLRKAIEVSAAAGLEVQMIGSGTAREQAPAPGTMVARGTQIVVRCAR